MHEKSSLNDETVYDQYPEGIGEIPALGTPVEVGLDVEVRRPDELQSAIDSGELGEIARGFVDKHKGALGFQFKGPRKVSMFVSEHSHGITKAVVGGAVGVAGVAFTAAIILYEHRKGKSK